MNRRERRRARSLKEFIASGDADRKGTPEFEAEVLRDEKLCLELEQHVRVKALLPWLAQHPEVDWTCTAPALLRLSALQVLVGASGTTPADFGVMAAEVAKSVVPLASEVGRRAKEVMDPNNPQAPAVKKALDDLKTSMRASHPAPKSREFFQTEAPAPPISETLTMKQVRLVLEQQTRDIAEKVGAWCPAGVGFMLFLADYGAKGNLAYVSSCDREDATRMVVDWLKRQLAEGPPGSS